MEDFIDETIEIFSVSLVGIEEEVTKISQNYQVLATAGVAKTSLNVPHLSLEELFQSSGDEKVKQVILEQQYAEGNYAASMDTKQLCEEYLATYFTFLNPRKFINILWDYTEIIEEKLNKTLSNSVQIGLLMHMAGVIERVLFRDPLNQPEEELDKTSIYYQAIKDANLLLESKLNMSIPDSELFYIVKIVDA